jgi:hypothetical protein
MARRLCAHIAPHPRPETAQSVELALSRWIPEAEESMLSFNDSGSPTLLEAYAERRLILKRLADGLAWHMFGSDGHWMRQQAAHPPISYAARKLGFQREREAVASALQRPDVLFAMQNDLTNVLRFHDVTFIDSEWSVHSVEVKSSTRWESTPRAERQRARTRALAEYLRTDETAALDGPPRRAISVDVDYAHYWAELERAVKDADANGKSWTYCDDAVAILCNKKGQPAPYDSVLTEWSKPSVTFGVLNRHMDSMDDDELVTVRPVTGFEISADALYPIVVGDVVAMTLVNLDHLRHAFAARGLTVEVKPDLQWRVSISPDETIDLLGGLWARLIYSLMSVPTFVAIVEGAVKAGRRGVRFSEG